MWASAATLEVSRNSLIMSGHNLRRNPKKREFDSDFNTNYNSGSSDDEQMSSNKGGRGGGVMSSAMRGANINHSKHGDDMANQQNGARDNTSNITNSQTNDVTINAVIDANVLDLVSGSGTTRVVGEAAGLQANQRRWETKVSEILRDKLTQTQHGLTL